MSHENNFELLIEVESGKKISLSVPDGVFVPTGTSLALIRAAAGFLRQPCKVCDLGCGTGVVGLALWELRLIKPPLYASDVSREAVAAARKNSLDYGCPVEARSGSLFGPWTHESFDCIVDDVSGIAEEVARVSTWFQNVPCNSGPDGTDLALQVLEEAPRHLHTEGCLLFPVISFSNTSKLLSGAKKNFDHVDLLLHEEWPLPKDLYQHLEMLHRLKKDGNITFEEKFGLILCYTDIYVAYCGEKQIISGGSDGAKKRERGSGNH